MKVPPTFKILLNNQALNITLKSNNGRKQANLTGWEVKRFTDKLLEIQLGFEDPLYISF